VHGISDEKIYDLIWQTGDDASIFGLDFPYNGKKEIQAAIDHLAGMNLSRETKQAIFGGNLHRILDIPGN
jgi:predicted TIM-barrel fold metal-dependent hydrolase